jgi:integral membrane protein
VTPAPGPAASSGALTRYRVMAYVTGGVLATSCLLGLSFWPWYVGEGTAGWLWTAHGYLYIVYVVTAFLLALRCRWSVVRTVLVMAAGTVPLMSFVAERRVTADLRRARDPAPAPPAPPA